MVGLPLQQQEVEQEVVITQPCPALPCPALPCPALSLPVASPARRCTPPLTVPQVLAGLASASANASNAAALRSTVPRETVIGLFRDLRGIATATNSRRTYSEGRGWASVQHSACAGRWHVQPDACAACRPLGWPTAGLSVHDMSCACRRYCCAVV